jgi:hypothetical protein
VALCPLLERRREDAFINGTLKIIFKFAPAYAIDYAFAAAKVPRGILG